MCKLGQIFYGRSRDGYGILGVSSSGHPFVGFVAQLCRAVGSPDAPGDIQPFLMSKREGSSVIMIRVCRGEADSTGRLTLFFHAFVASFEALSLANLDAFLLAEKGLFLSSLPECIEDIEVSPSTVELDSSSSGELHYLAYVSSDRPLDAEVRRALGCETLKRNWATYSYRPLNGFDLCVHSSYALSPTSGNRYTFENGHFVVVDDSLVEPSRPLSQKLSHTKTSSNSSFMLKTSLFVNAILIISLILVFVSNYGNQLDIQKSTAPDGMTKEEAFKKWGMDWESDFRSKLRTSFETRLGDNRRILDFEKEMTSIDPYYIDYKSGKAEPPTSKALDIYAALNAYVSVFEAEIMTTRQERENQ